MELTIWEIFFCSHFPSFVAMQIQVWTGLPLGRNDNEDPLCSMGKRTTGSGCSGYAIMSAFMKNGSPLCGAFQLGHCGKAEKSPAVDNTAAQSF